MKDKSLEAIIEKEFERTGFGNQMRIVGTKRVELKDSIYQIAQKYAYQSKKELLEEIEDVIDDAGDEEGNYERIMFKLEELKQK